jgi:ribonucleoside-triphosphate reductase (thioredoxin)
MSTISNKIFSDIIVYDKYARLLKEAGRKETWDEILDRNVAMHCAKYPRLSNDIRLVYDKFVRPKKVLPSMRSLQFGGKPIERNPSRIYNCAYMPMDSVDSFSELMFLLLGGVGVGYSVQYRHVNKLPRLPGPTNVEEPRRYIVGDTIEGWADSIKVLSESYIYGKDKVRFDFDDIREKGSELVVTGGKAPGPEPLKICLTRLEAILKYAVGRRLTPIEVHDMACHIADAVLSGGIRRAAMISLFSVDDIEMMCAKTGSWWESNPQRGRANNSVILHRKSTTEEEFDVVWSRIRKSGSGEPGVYWTSHFDWGTNPCCEIALKPYQFCNLTEVNVSDVESQEDLNQRCAAAAFVGTLQAGYTDFHYLRPIWKKTTSQDALIGVGMTGIASGEVLKYNLQEAAEVVKAQNEEVSKALGINIAARCTTVKPSGTSSIVLGSSSGIHAWHAPYYIRRIRLNNDQPLLKYLKKNMPEIVEQDWASPNSSVVSIPQEAPKAAIFRDEGPTELFQRAMRFNDAWVYSGHRKGVNTNNVSCTLSLKDEDWDLMGKLLWENRGGYNGMSVLPHDGGSYVQAPFEEITEEQYRKLESVLTEINLTDIVEIESASFVAEPACAGGVCEI